MFEKFAEFFPARDGAVTGVTVLARGEMRPDVGTPSFPVSPVGGVSLLPVRLLFVLGLSVCSVSALWQEGRLALRRMT